MNASFTTSAAFFEAMYQRNADPWNFASKPEELLRYAAIISTLAGRRYRRAFEPGCSVGVLTDALAGICDEVVARDLSETAVERARHRTAGMPGVSIQVGSLTEGLPPGSFDLLVLSEIGYYFTPRDWNALLDRLIAPLEPGTTVLASHWLGESDDHLMHGDDVHAILRSRRDLRLTQQERHETFRLDRWERA
jgi:protein-L-isoaspartate O-methyltransferase